MNRQVKPVDLQPGDRILTVATRKQKTVRTVVRVDHVEPGFVRTVEHGIGHANGKKVDGEWYETYHPNWDIQVSRD